MNKFTAELLGTMVLLLCGCGAVVISGANLPDNPISGIGMLGIALAFGLAVVSMAYAIGGISGCHINPAITIGMLVAGNISTKDAISYIIAQIAGAILGVGILFLIVSNKGDYSGIGEWGMASTGWGPGYGGNYNTTAAFIAEFVFTFIFLLVIFGSTSKWGNSTAAGLAIGLSLTMIHLAIIPVSGSSLNPARSIGSAVFAQGMALSQLWLFIVAPILGAITSALVWKNLIQPKN